MIPQTSDVKMTSFIILVMMMRAMDDDIFSDLIRSGVTGEMNNLRCGLFSRDRTFLLPTTAS
jgi:hypothetical protein